MFLRAEDTVEKRYGRTKFFITPSSFDMFDLRNPKVGDLPDVVPISTMFFLSFENEDILWFEIEVITMELFAERLIDEQLVMKEGQGARQPDGAAEDVCLLFIRD